MARPKETFEASITNISYTDSEVRVWMMVESKDRDVLVRLTQESAESFIADIKAAFVGIEQRKAKLAEAKYNQYLALKAEFESAATVPVVTE